jgi:urease accessory protein
VSVRAHSPLRLMATPGDGAPWIFATTFGGGLVDGDRIDLTVDVEAGARALLTTQASTKVYKSPRGTTNILRARVAEGAVFASIPDATVCFAGARFTQEIHVSLAEGASATVVDVLHAGRVSRGERWAMEHYRSTIVVDQRLRDAMLLDPSDGPIAARMGRFNVLGTVVMLGPHLAAARERIVGELGAPERSAEVVMSGSLRDDLLLVRFAAVSSERAVLCLRTLLAETTALVGDVLARKR